MRKVNSTVYLETMAKKSKLSSVVFEADSSGRLTDRKRCAIVQAAVQEFQTRGFYAASMNGIADAASVSKRTLYNHFDSKESLFDAIIDELTLRSQRLPTTEFDPTRGLAEQLRELAEAEVDFITSDDVQALARACMSRVLAEPEVGKQVDHRRFAIRIESFLEQAQASGCLAEMDIEFAAMQFLGLLRTFAFWPMILHGEAPPTRKKREQIVSSSVELFLSQYSAI